MSSQECRAAVSRLLGKQSSAAARASHESAATPFTAARFGAPLQAGLLGVAVWSMACGSVAETENHFVTRIRDQVELDGEPFHFAGSNNYYQMYVSEFMVDDVLETAARAGFNTMRVWGSLDIGTPDGTDSVRGPSRDVYMHYWDGTAPAFNDGPDGLERLDYVIAKAGELGLKLVIPFVNNWNDFGGMDQYVRWREISSGEERQWFHDDFYTDPLIRGWYQAWIAHVLERVNTRTGIAYKDDPTIAIWELGNEPRCTSTGAYSPSESCTTATLTAWADDMSTFIKRIDAHHLVSVGDEGFYCVEGGTHWTEQCGDGVDSLAFAQLPNIDVMSFHLYPDAWGTDAAWGTEWIRRHAADAHAIGKVSLLGEFGLRDPRIRNRVYRDWLDTLQSNDGNGGLYWILSGQEDDGSRYADSDGFTIYEDNPVFQTIANFVQQLTGTGQADFPPVADHDSGFVTHDETGVFDVLANDISYPDEPLTLDLDVSQPGPQSVVSIDGSRFEVKDNGILVAPAPGFLGRLALPYQVNDSEERASNTALLSIVVSPDPALLSSFEAGLENWAPLNANNGSVAQSSLFASDGTFGAEVNGTGNNWYGVTLDPPLDLSARHAISFDVQVGPVDGTNRALRIFFGSVRCQSALTWVPQNTTANVQIEFGSMSCTGGVPDYTNATQILLRFNAGTFHFDNVQLK